MTNRKSVGFILRDAFSDDAVIDRLAVILGVPTKELEWLQTEGFADPAAFVEVVQRDRGFRTEVALYLDPERIRFSPVEIVRRAAAAFASDLLVDLPPPIGRPSDPSSWLLVSPNDRAFRVRERDDRDEDTMEIDENPAHMESIAPPWPTDGNRG